VTTHTITLPAGNQADITVDEHGSGHPFLLLHGGAGPQSMTGFAQRLAAGEHAHVFVPTHPGFGGTARPKWLNSMGALADSYVMLIERLDLFDVTVIGNSIGGWIAAEMALRKSTRIGSFILVDAVGIAVEGQSVVDIFSLTLDEVMQLSYHNPAPYRRDPTTLTDAEKRGIAANRQALAIYSGQPSKVDPTLVKRLSAVTAPTLVLWGDSDGIVSPDYGRAFAAAIPTARFQLLSDTGHMPQIESPDKLLAAIRDFINILAARPPNTR
jgi:pimeloyl-ACP methyl ester carboxylesterase